MPTIQIDIPQDIADSFFTVDELRQTVYEDFIIEQRQQGKISLGRAAELLGVTYREFFLLLGQKGLSFINVTADELHRSYAHFVQVMKEHSAT